MTADPNSKVAALLFMVSNIKSKYVSIVMKLRIC